MLPLLNTVNLKRTNPNGYNFEERALVSSATCSWKGPECRRHRHLQTECRRISQVGQRLRQPGGGYAKDGQKQQAIANYRKSLRLDPKNQNAASELKNSNKSSGILSSDMPSSITPIPWLAAVSLFHGLLFVFLFQHVGNPSDGADIFMIILQLFGRFYDDLVSLPGQQPAPCALLRVACLQWRCPSLPVHQQHVAPLRRP